MKINIIIKTQFEAIHCWKTCNIEDVAFLKNPHRHIFYVIIKWEVLHTNRDKEFISMKRKIEAFTQSLGKDLGESSCEDIALLFFKQFPTANYISIFEDNENGAEIII